ncbi:hypothetical protein BJY18_003811 [Amycolatopsis jiangsuensis]|uniref:Uncharacterized protein n=1 Tax=Amycolatopsis jiangsuensis TaxID=1181879 RepID=A0A840IUY9_9PSEU|nr:hypothetical protein [Amycolatopsis jiangsuensis]
MCAEKRDELLDVANLGQNAADRGFEVPPPGPGQVQL